MLDAKEVKRLAKLARIHLKPEEVETLRRELDAILGYVRQLQKINTNKVEPTAQVTGLENVMRPDKELDYGTDREGLLANAPASDKGYIKVKRVQIGQQ